jgi:predicted small lipoprotein YifL
MRRHKFFAIVLITLTLTGCGLNGPTQSSNWDPSDQTTNDSGNSANYDELDQMSEDWMNSFNCHDDNSCP